MKNAFAAGVLVVGLAFPLSAWATSGLYSLSYGAKSGGMAGATLVSGDDALNQIINPANLSLIDSRFDVNIMYLRSNLHFENSGTYSPIVPGVGGTTFTNDRDNERGFDSEIFPFTDNNFLVPSLGFVVRFKDSGWLGPINTRDLGFGFHLTGLGGDASRFFLNHPLLGPDERFRANLVLMNAGPAVSYRVNKYLSVGVQGQILAGRFQFDQPVAFDPGTFALGSSPGLAGFGLTNFGQFFRGIGITEGVGDGKLTDVDFTFGGGARVGVTVTPHDRVSLSATYQSERHLTFTGKARFDFTRQLQEAGFIIAANPAGNPFVASIQAALGCPGGCTPAQVNAGFMALGFNPALGFKTQYNAEVPFTLPQQVDAGIAVRVLPQLVAEADFGWIQWSATDPFETFRVDLRNGTNPNINLIIGSPDVDFFIKTRWRDQYVYRLGAAWAAFQAVTLRGGYSYASNPIRESGALVTFPAYGFHTLTAGGTAKLGEKWDVSAAFERAFERTVKVGASQVDSFHSNSKESHEQFSVYLQLGRRF
ncbi:MAG: outer membrane protein transport protein [Candidatus Rokubacteria bacterium]|nr:outer membrane protein transport protein [Candidatus Rokubacteria bacterium]